MSPQSINFISLYNQLISLFLFRSCLAVNFYPYSQAPGALSHSHYHTGWIFINHLARTSYHLLMLVAVLLLVLYPFTLWNFLFYQNYLLSRERGDKCVDKERRALLDVCIRLHAPIPACTNLAALCYKIEHLYPSTASLYHLVLSIVYVICALVYFLALNVVACVFLCYLLSCAVVFYLVWSLTGQCNHVVTCSSFGTQELFGGAGTQVPELEGEIYHKVEGQKTWKKMTAVLRSSGLYSRKGKVCVTIATIVTYRIIDLVL